MRRGSRNKFFREGSFAQRRQGFAKGAKLHQCRQSCHTPPPELESREPAAAEPSRTPEGRPARDEGHSDSWTEHSRAAVPASGNTGTTPGANHPGGAAEGSGGRLGSPAAQPQQTQQPGPEQQAGRRLRNGFDRVTPAGRAEIRGHDSPAEWRVESDVGKRDVPDVEVVSASTQVPVLRTGPPRGTGPVIPKLPPSTETSQTSPTIQQSSSDRRSIQYQEN